MGLSPHRGSEKYKVKGTGITLSREQHAEFRKRIKEEGLQDMLDVKLMDYRDLPKEGKTYDRVVSVGMVEHVGRENYQLFNDCVRDVLKDGGLFLLHFISALKNTREMHGLKIHLPGRCRPKSQGNDRRHGKRRLPCPRRGKPADALQ